MKNQLMKNIENIIREIERGNDITIKKSKDGIRILSIKVKNITA